MQIILLSGGSGKRLWPLSNNARSKQFLPLLDSGNGTKESMVQRVVRQCKEAGIEAEITFATNKTQVDVIINQLGEGVSIVVEPERRDTFPAIALASSYLAMEKGCPADEVVVVMPCDPYTESGYFKTILKMVECVEARTADLVLMGIMPTYPSSKYGYIVPKTHHEDTECLEVERFTEKPSVEQAEELIKADALWNGGVFAFRLGYMTEIAGRYINSNDYETIRSRYDAFPKISFDYEVAEKAESVAVVPFTGSWKDLGTWNTLTDELRNNTIGNAVIGANCENVHVINELQHPIFTDGLKDVVVAASPDGILVCSKNKTEGIKEYVDQLITRPMYEERRWGTYRVLDDAKYDNGAHSLTKSITLFPGKFISYQIHHHRSEVWTFVEGEGLFVMDGECRNVKAGDTVIIPVEHWHSIKALTKLTFIEVQTGDPLIEEDIERKEWEW